MKEGGGGEKGGYQIRRFAQISSKSTNQENVLSEIRARNIIVIVVVVLVVVVTVVIIVIVVVVVVVFVVVVECAIFFTKTKTNVTLLSVSSESA